MRVVEVDLAAERIKSPFFAGDDDEGGEEGNGSEAP